jgi:pimeloyl-ACP methyl ester carboxylesterase
VTFAVRARVSDTLFTDKTTEAAWRSKPSWYAVSRRDRTISPELWRFLAHRMQARTLEFDSGHLSMISQPQQISQLIMVAAQAAGERDAIRGRTEQN